MKQLNGGTQMTDVWRIPSVGTWEKTCGKHPTQKTLRLLYRIILASTNKGDTILDPFAGSSTTGIAANLLGRKFIGIEKEEKFIELSQRRRTLLENTEEAEKLLYRMREMPEEATVLVNHARKKDYELMVQKGLCYLRAGDSKGSLLVQKGFERLGYVLLHSNGENARLFPLAKKGFQIWTAKSLQELGFTAENAPYYAVIRFDANQKISHKLNINLKQGTYTNIAKIRPLRDFIEI